MSEKPEQNIVVGFRHFKDIDAIKTYGLDGPLIDNNDNEQLAETTSAEILSIAQKCQISCVRIMFSSGLRRIDQTVKQLVEKFSDKIAVSLEENNDLSPFDQGRPILPQDYKDGEPLSAFIDAWDAYCDATYLYKNVHYKFGDPDMGVKVKSELIGKFEVIGESEAEYLLRKYNFLLGILNERARSEELLVFCSQSIPLLLLHEIFAIERDAIEVSPEELHFLCWEYFMNEVKEKHNPAFGQVSVFDLSGIDIPKWRSILQRAKEFLKAQRNGLKT